MPDSQFPSEEAVEAGARAIAHRATGTATVQDRHRTMAREVLTAAAPFLSPERSGGGERVAFSRTYGFQGWSETSMPERALAAGWEVRWATLDPAPTIESKP